MLPEPDRYVATAGTRVLELLASTHGIRVRVVWLVGWLAGSLARAGVKFFVTADRNHQHLEQTLRAIYELYSDYVLKNPFYELDQPIRCERFQQSLQALISRSRE